MQDINWTKVKAFALLAGYADAVKVIKELLWKNSKPRTRSTNWHKLEKGEYKTYHNTWIGKISKKFNCTPNDFIDYEK